MLALAQLDVAAIARTAFKVVPARRVFAFFVLAFPVIDAVPAVFAAAALTIAGTFAEVPDAACSRRALPVHFAILANTF